jgi:ABC-2 type transport system permease protein
MNPVTRQLILKDWRLHRSEILFTIECGAVALGLLFFKREPVVVVGSVWFFVSLILIGCMLPATNILNERKKQNLPFLMSLPVSPLQYATAKLLSTVGMFLVPWLTLVIAAVWVIAGRGIFPHGTIPMALILVTLPFIGFSLIMGLTLVGETEGWNIVGNVVCNSSYGLIWYFIGRTPALTRDFGSKVAVWNSAVLTILGAEFALIALILGMTFYLQSRKRDFI